MILVLISSLVIVPLVFLTWLWTASFTSRLLWLTQALATSAYIGFSVIVAPWGWLSFYIRGLLLVLLVAGLVVSFRKSSASWWPAGFGKNTSNVLFLGVQALLALILVPMTLYALSGFLKGPNPVTLDFPLKHGVYNVGHGGSNPMVNYHNVSKTQQYALDIGRLNKWGLRASGFQPANLESYAIYGDTLYSPCDGTVKIATDSLPDMTPPAMDKENPPGNHIVIACKGIEVWLAHLIPGSIPVAQGQAIAIGEVIGRVGNSGNTSEPHLHIHAERAGEGVPLTIDGRFLVRNALVWR